MGIACKELVVLPHGLARIVDDPLLMAMNAQPDTLLDLFEPWQREAQPKTKTADEYKKTIHEFHECVGLFPLTSIKTEHVRRYKDSLVSKGSLAAGSSNQRVGVIKTLLNFAKANGYIESNPAEGIKVKRTKAVAQRHPFTNNEIKAIFTSPVFKSNHRPRAGTRQCRQPLTGVSRLCR